MAKYLYQFQAKLLVMRSYPGNVIRVEDHREQGATSVPVAIVASGYEAAKVLADESLPPADVDRGEYWATILESVHYFGE